MQRYTGLGVRRHIGDFPLAEGGTTQDPKTNPFTAPLSSSAVYTQHLTIEEGGGMLLPGGGESPARAGK